MRRAGLIAFLFLVVAGSAGMLAIMAPPAGGATTVSVTVGPSGSLVFSPAITTAHLGDTVHWTWGSSGHTTTDATGLKLWDSGIRSAGATFNHTFQHSGIYRYECTVHVSFGMTGAVKVPLILTKVSATKVTVRWAGETPPTGFVEDVQREKGSSGFTALVTGATATSKTVTLTAGTWHFRARYRNTTSGKHSAYSPVATISIS